MSYRAALFEKLLQDIQRDIDANFDEQLKRLEGLDKRRPEAMAKVLGEVSTAQTELLEGIYARIAEVLRRD